MSEMFTREFRVEFTGDGRTLDMRVVPYNEVATVSDPPDYRPYQEMFLEGSFDGQLNAPNRVSVLVNFEHDQGLRSIIGHGTELRSEKDGLYGSFRVLEGADGDKALQLVHEGVATGVSVEFASKRSKVVNGVTQRIQAHLDKLALTRTGLQAYKTAEVLAVRTEAVEFEPVELNTALTERLENLGYEKLVHRAIVRGAWNGAASRFEDDEWRRSCILDRGEQFDTAKTRYAFPVLEPNGDLNVNGMHAAAGRLNQAGASSQAKAAAARKLIRYYRQAQEEPPPSLVAMAGR